MSETEEHQKIIDLLSQLVEKNSDDNEFVEIDNEGSRVRKSAFVKRINLDVENLKQNTRIMQEQSISLEGQLKDIGVCIDENNIALKDIQKNIPKRFITRLSEASKVSNDIMGAGKLIVVIFLVLFFLVSFIPDTLVEKFIPTQSQEEIQQMYEGKFQKLEEKMDDNMEIFENYMKKMDSYIKKKDAK